MLRCTTCNSEVADSSKGCPSCGTPVGVTTGSLATVAMEAGPLAAAAAANGSKSPQPAASSRSSISRLSETSIPDDGRFLPGTLVNGRYRIIGLLGRGGMGEVYRATDLTLAQPVALKFLPEAGVTERVLERFHAEVRIARQVSHPNICRVYDIGEVDGQPFISMEYVDGEDLASLLQRIGRLPNDKALDTARKICAGLAAAHDRGVIHRDLKPANIMLNRRGEPVIMDFGLAAVADQLTGAEARNGTPAYMAPEQLRGDEVTTKSDIYALGLVLYELFSGKRAYEAKTIAELLKLQEGAHVTSLTSLAADVDPQVEKVIRRCLSPDPVARPSSALNVAAALPGGDPLAAALAAGETPSPEMVAASGKTEGMDLRYSIPLLAFVVVVLIALPVIGTRSTILTGTPVSYPPVVVEHEARKIAASFGYTQRPADSLIQFEDGSPARDYWKTHDRKGKSWKDLMAAEPFYSYFYRESPNPLAAEPFGWANSTNPAPHVAGMIAMRLSFAAQLREFEAIVPEKPEGGAAGAAFDEAALFKAIGLPQSGFAEAAPEIMPMVAFDLRKAWAGKAPGLPDVDVRVEAASLKGKLTAVKVVFPWTPARREAEKPTRGAALAGPLVSMVMSACAVLFALIFSIRNLRKNRADRQGAFRVALVSGLLMFINWIGYAHHVADLNEWNFLSSAVGDALYSGVVIWILYLAIEPTVRARWPHAMVTWNRLLAGKFGDAQLGAHMLVGAAIGMVIALAFLFYGWVDSSKSGVPTLDNLETFQGALTSLGWGGGMLHGALFTGFIVFFVIFAFRAWLKNDYWVALATALLFGTIGNNGIWNSSNPWLDLPLMVAIFGVLAFALLRMGMISTIFAIIFINTTGKINFGPSLNSWYTPYSLATFAILVGIATYSFWRSIGSRTFVEDEELR